MDGNGTKGYRISRGTAELIGRLGKALSLAVEHEEAARRAGWTEEELELAEDAFYQGVDRQARGIEKEIARNIRMRLMISGGEEI